VARLKSCPDTNYFIQDIEITRPELINLTAPPSDITHSKRVALFSHQ
jgi:hypothetical protein